MRQQFLRRTFLKNSAIALGVVAVCNFKVAGIAAQEELKDVVAILKFSERSVSVAVEEVSPSDRAEKVYQSDILNNADKL